MRYKKEYNTHYNEYLRYHEILRQAKSRFTKLSKQRENLQRGTPEYRVSQFYFSYAQVITFDIESKAFLDLLELSYRFQSDFSKLGRY